MSNNKYKILIVEDESSIRNFVETILEANDYQTITADNCQNALMMFRSYIPDLVILDLGLPDCDGIEFIKTIRKEDAAPIIVLSARTNESDKVEALDCGANDYVTKPFGTPELLARVRAALRNRRHSLEDTNGSAGKFVLRDMEINYDRRKVIIGGKEIKLTQTEYNILALLAAHSGKVMTYAAIIKEIWGGVDVGGVKRLQVNMANLRKKLGSRPGDSRYIVNELGVGYRICEENEE